MKKTVSLTAIIISAVLSATVLAGCSTGGSGDATSGSPNLANDVSQVINTISQSTSASSKADAANLSYACKNMYAEVVAGTVRSESPGTMDPARLPSLKDSNATVKEAALKLTIEDALAYGQLSFSTLEHFVFDPSTGDIYSELDDARPSEANDHLTSSTTLAILGYK